MSEATERVARAVCAHSLGGFCQYVGGDLGCKNGRGVAPHWRNCVASEAQLGLSGHEETARAAIAAMQESSAPPLT